LQHKCLFMNFPTLFWKYALRNMKKEWTMPSLNVFMTLRAAWLPFKGRIVTIEIIIQKITIVIIQDSVFNNPYSSKLDAS
jgi:hypothetical protein